jgi:hypothetical protein
MPLLKAAGSPAGRGWKRPAEGKDDDRGTRIPSVHEWSENDLCLPVEYRSDSHDAGARCQRKDCLAGPRLVCRQSRRVYV